MRIENEQMSVEASLHGGSLTSIFDRTKQMELLYQPVEGSWKGQDIFQFPFIARLLGGTYEVDGKTYSMRNHGVLRYVDFFGKKINDQAMELSFQSNDATLQEFPYAFKALVRYELDGRSMKATYTLINEDTKPFPFGCGCHPAFALPGKRDESGFDVRGNRIVFPEETKLTLLRTEETGRFMTGEDFTLLTKEIHLSKALFSLYPTLILKTEAPTLALVRKDGVKLTIHRGEAPYLALWNDGQGPYVAIEQWYSVPDYLDAPKELSEKKTLHVLLPHQSFSYSYSVVPE